MNKEKESKVVPNVRFKGFTDDWKQRKLGECFTERVESMPDGELISVTINDGIRKFSELGKHDNSNDDKSKYKKVCVGDIAYNSMRMWQGASGYSPYEGIVSPAYTVLSPNSGVNSKCLAYQFKLPGMIHTFQINSQGITSDNWNLKYPALSEIEIFVSTDEEEQAKIAEYFENFDRLITFHQQKITLLTKLKKAMLEKMFPKKGTVIPEFRFNGFANAWEQRKLGNVAKFSKGSGYSKGDLIESGTPIILYGRLYTKYETSISEVDTYVEAKDGSVYSKGGEVIVPASGETAEDIARAATVDKSGVILGGDLNVVSPNEDINSAFLAISISHGNSQRELAKKAQGKSVVHIHNEEIKNLVVPFPAKAEQNKIVEYFSNLDNLITLHQRKLDMLKKLKSACLSEMFI